MGADAYHGGLAQTIVYRRIVMCTLAIYVRHLPGFPLVIAANRDEFVDRAAAGPQVLAEAPRVVGGRDLQAGGTWLAISERGTVAGLLNRRTEALPIASKRSRGELPLRALAAGSAAAAAAVIGALRGDTYNAFNLLVADRERGLGRAEPRRRDAAHGARPGPAPGQQPRRRRPDVPEDRALARPLRGCRRRVRAGIATATRSGARCTRSCRTTR